MKRYRMTVYRITLVSKWNDLTLALDVSEEAYRELKEIAGQPHRNPVYEIYREGRQMEQGIPPRLLTPEQHNKIRSFFRSCPNFFETIMFS